MQKNQNTDRSIVEALLMEHLAGDTGWLRDTPEVREPGMECEFPHGYFLEVSDNNTEVQRVAMSREEYISIKRHLALMRIERGVLDPWCGTAGDLAAAA